MNQYERAVIEAARAWRANPGESTALPLRLAVQALDDHERIQAAAGITEAGWHTVTAGDEIQGASGKFYPVLGVQALAGEQWQIRVQVGDIEKVITRPTEKVPLAAVKRGPDGKVVQQLVNVFTSGGTP